MDIAMDRGAMGYRVVVAVVSICCAFSMKIELNKVNHNGDQKTTPSVNDA